MMNVRDLQIEILHPGTGPDFASDNLNRIICLDLSEFKSQYGAKRSIEELMGYVGSFRCGALRLHEDWPADAGREAQVGEISWTPPIGVVSWLEPDSNPDCEDPAYTHSFEEASCVFVLATSSELEQGDKNALIHAGANLYEKPDGYDQACDDDERVQILKRDFETQFEDVGFTEGEHFGDQQSEEKSGPDPRVYSEPPYQVSEADLLRLLHRAQAPDGWKKDD